MSLEGAFREQAMHNRALGSPFTARVLRLAAERAVPGNPVVDRMLAWEGDIGPFGASLPLRFLSGLHALVLTGACPALVAAYPPNPASDDKTLGAAIDAALAEHQDVLMRWIDNPPQTNEVRRASVMIAAGQWLADRFGLPFVLSELGASAGLNLMWDRFCLALACGTFGPKRSSVWLDPDWRGPCPPKAEVTVIDRRGVDLRPMNPHDAEDALRLVSFLWADQPQRIDRSTRATPLAGSKRDWPKAIPARFTSSPTPLPGNTSPTPPAVAAMRRSRRLVRAPRPTLRWRGCRWKPTTRASPVRRSR
jgi:hypothetical protein